MKQSLDRVHPPPLTKNLVKMFRIHDSKSVRFIRNYATTFNIVVAIAVFGVSVLAIWVAAIPPFPWLPEPGEAAMLLGTLLTAQAAIAALTLAVTLFVVQGASTKEDVDRRMYSEYIRRSWVREIFSCSLVVVGVTGLALLGESFLSPVPAPHLAPGLRNLALISAIAFVANLTFAALLLEQAIRIARPDSWQSIRQYVNERDVQEAVELFLIRYNRTMIAMDTGEWDYSAAFPAPGEGSANEAIRNLRDDGLRAMGERRLEQVERVLLSIRDLIIYALDELGRAGFRWSAPGAQPQWPPLRELSNNLYPFREEVVSRGEIQLAYDLQDFDSWCMAEGMRRSCGELFTVGLTGYQQNYEIANRFGNGLLRELFGEKFWDGAYRLVADALSQEDYLYTKQMVGYQEHILNHAMQIDSSADYLQLHESFEDCIRTTSRFMRNLSERRTTSMSEIGRLEQDYRIALMGLAGRAVLLANSGIIADPSPYLNIARGKHNRAQEAADDIAQALAHDNIRGNTLWRNWEMEGVGNFQTVSLRPEKYPLMWFAIRVIELSTEPLQSLNLRGQAQRILGWFETNSSEIEAHVAGNPDLTFEARREFATTTLRAAVYADEIAEDYAIIESELSACKVSKFKTEAYESAFATNSIKRLFERAAAVLRLRTDAEQVPEERPYRDWPPKAFLADIREDNPTSYAPLKGDHIGRMFSKDVVQVFCKALEEAPQVASSLNTPEKLLQVIDNALTDLNASGEIVVVLDGDWAEVAIGLDGEVIEEYVPTWQIPEEDSIGEIGRYREHPIVRTHTSGNRHVYVVEIAMWGWFIDATLEPHHDIIIEVNPVSAERAREWLNQSPELFSDQPDESSKIRKLQTLVEIVASHRIGFLVIDRLRARRIDDDSATDL